MEDVAVDRIGMEEVAVDRIGMEEVAAGTFDSSIEPVGVIDMIGTGAISTARIEAVGALSERGIDIGMTDTDLVSGARRRPRWMTRIVAIESGKLTRLGAMTQKDSLTAPKTPHSR